MMNKCKKCNIQKGATWSEETGHGEKFLTVSGNHPRGNKEIGQQEEA